MGEEYQCITRNSPLPLEATASEKVGGGGRGMAACTFVYLVQEETVLALPRESLVMCGVAVTERV